MSDPFNVVRDFEEALCKYTGAPYAVTTTSCTMALLLAVKYQLTQMPQHVEVDQCSGCGIQRARPVNVEIPKRTYVGVPMSIIHAGGKPTFRDEDWSGAYQLKPLPVWDSARRFRRHMMLPYDSADMVCVSFHWSKTLGIEQGGAILLSDAAADKWLRMARFDGRQEGVPILMQTDWTLGYHAYMSPETAAKGLMRLSLLTGHEPDLPNSNYPDLSTLEIFK